MSCLLPYCDAMFIDKEIATYWREIQGTPSRRLPFETRVFSLSNKVELLAYLDELSGLFLRISAVLRPKRTACRCLDHWERNSKNKMAIKWFYG